jgi:hypothetical protein
MEHSWLKERYDDEIDCLRHHRPSPFHDALAAERASYREHVAFIACFSTERDVLSQWRAYADDGAGFAIGFNPNYFDLNLSAPSYGSDQGTTHGLFPVCYDLDEQIALIKKIIEHYRTESQQQDADVKKYAADCYFNLQMVSIICKNPAFAEEKEWRICYRPMIWRTAAGLEILGGNNDIDFRASRSNLIPYFKLSFSEKRQIRPIEEVVLGPKRSLTKELDVLSWFFEKNEVTVAGLRRSTATYR